MRYALWDMTGRRRDYDPLVRGSRAPEERKRVGREVRVRPEKIGAALLRLAHERRAGKATDVLEGGPEGCYGVSLG